MFLLDTDTLSNSMLPRPSQNLLRKLGEVDAGSQHLSTISLGELLTGAYSPRARPGLLARIETILARLRLLDFDAAAARALGPIAALLNNVGTPIGVEDTQIAAIAIANDLTVVTANVRHFARVPGLRVENWL